MENPSPKVVCREIARRWEKDMVIIIALDVTGPSVPLEVTVATCGRLGNLRDRGESLSGIVVDAVKEYLNDSNNYYTMD